MVTLLCVYVRWMITLLCVCQVDGNPKPTVSWRRAEDTEVLSINRQLKISPVSRYDAGTYVCSANNIVGTGALQQWTIDVQCKFENLLYPGYKLRKISYIK